MKNSWTTRVCFVKGCLFLLVWALATAAVASEVDYSVVVTPNAQNTGGTWTIYATITDSSVSSANSAYISGWGNTVYGLAGFNVNVTATNGAVITSTNLAAPAGTNDPVTGGNWGFSDMQSAGTISGGSVTAIHADQMSLGQIIYNSGQYQGVGQSAQNTTLHGATWGYPVELAYGNYSFTYQAGTQAQLLVSDNGPSGPSDPTSVLIGYGSYNGNSTYADLVQSGLVDVPEPSTLAALISGALCGLAWWGWRGRRRVAPVAAQA